MSSKKPKDGYIPPTDEEDAAYEQEYMRQVAAGVSSARPSMLDEQTMFEAHSLVAKKRTTMQRPTGLAPTQQQTVVTGMSRADMNPEEIASLHETACPYAYIREEDVPRLEADEISARLWAPLILTSARARLASVCEWVDRCSMADARDQKKTVTTTFDDKVNRHVLEYRPQKDGTSVCVFYCFDDIFLFILFHGSRITAHHFYGLETSTK